MPHLLHLPVEVRDLIAEHLEFASELNALSRTCRTLYSSAHRRLYDPKECSPKGFKNIVKHKNVDALRQILPGFLDQGYDKQELFEGSGRLPLMDAAENLVAIIQIFVDPYGPKQNFHDIANPECAQAVLAPQDLIVLKVLSRATKSSEIGGIALGIAAGNGSLDCLKFFFGCGCKVDMTNDFGQSALVKAAGHGHLEMVKYLVEAGADPNFISEPPSFMGIQNWAGHPRRTPLWAAALNNQEAIVRYLLEKNAHLGTPGELNTCEISTISSHDGGPALAKIILDSSGCSSDLDTKLEQLSAPEMRDFLRYAAARGDERPIKAFAHHLAVAQIVPSLHSAAQHGHANVVATLLDTLVGPRHLTWHDIIENFIMTINIAAEQNHQPVVVVVLEYAKRRGIILAGQEALLTAVRHGHDALCQFLVQMGVLDDVETDDSDERYDDDADEPPEDRIPKILCEAIKQDNVVLFKNIMQKSGFKPLRPNLPGGDSILEMAAEGGSLELFQEISQGVTLDPSDPVCYKALLRAISHGQIRIVSYFLQHGFDVNGTYRTQNPGMDDDDYYFESGLDRGITLLIQSVTPWTMYDRQWDVSPMTQFLLDHGAEVDAVGPRGRTALAEAAKQLDNNSSAKVLVERGANPLIGLEKCRSALDWAIREDNLKMVELFLQTIVARGYQPVDVELLIYRHMSTPSMIERKMRRAGLGSSSRRRYCSITGD